MPTGFVLAHPHAKPSAIREIFAALGQPGMISFAGGMPDPALMDKEGLAQATTAALQDHGALQYGATEGIPKLRATLAERMRTEGATHVGPQNLIVTTGSQQALYLLADVLIKPGSTVLVEQPTYLSAIECFRMKGANVIAVPPDADPAHLRELIGQHKPAFFYTNPNFRNPSGETMSQERRLEWLRISKETRMPIIEDNPYGELYFDQPPPPSLLALSSQVEGSRDNLAYCGSISKTISPSLRIGYMVAPQEVLREASVHKQYADACNSSLLQGAAHHYLQSGRLEPQLETMRAAYAKRANAMCEALQGEFGDAVEFTRPQGGLFVWARLTGKDGQSADAQAFADAALRHGVAFVPGHNFDAQGQDTASFRLSFATADEATIGAGVKKMCAAYVELCAASKSTAQAGQDTEAPASQVTDATAVSIPVTSGGPQPRSPHWKGVVAEGARSTSPSQGQLKRPSPTPWH